MKITTTNYETTLGIIKSMRDKFKNSVWSEDTEKKSVLTFKEKSTIIGTITIEGEPENDNKISVDGTGLETFFEELLNRIKKYDNKEEIKLNFLDKYNSNPEIYNHVMNNTIVAAEIRKSLMKSGVKKIICGSGTFTLQKSIFKHPTILVDPSITSAELTCHETNYINRLKSILFDKFSTKFSNVEQLPGIQNNGLFTRCLFEEPTDMVPITAYDILLGVYYKKRNLIILCFNPFLLNNFVMFNDTMPEIFKFLMKSISDLKIKTFNVSGIEAQLVAETFIKQVKEKIKEVDSNLQNNFLTIKKYETELLGLYIKSETFNKDIQYLTLMKNSDCKNILKEIEDTKKLPFLEKVDIDSGKIYFKYKPTCVTIPEFTRVGKTKKYGKRTFYLGSIEFEIGSNTISLTNLEMNKYFGHGHPHAGGTKSANCCFGSGDGRDKIFSALSTFKFTDLAKLLWFWIKIYRDDAAYYHSHNFYDRAMVVNWPVWDEKGKRIIPNDPDRIKTGEQVSQTIEVPATEEMTKLYKDIKMC